MVLCEVCEEKPASLTVLIPKGGDVKRLRVCHECQRNIESKEDPSDANSSSPFGPAYDDASFENFVGSEHQEYFDTFNCVAPSTLAKYTASHVSALTEARNQTASFTDAVTIGGHKSYRFFISGGPGVGKTHLLAASVSRMRQAGLKIAVRSAYEFIAQMLATYSDRVATERKVQSQIITELARYDVVVIDDLNLEIVTEATPRYMGWLFMELSRRNIVLMVASQFSFKDLSKDRDPSKPNQRMALGTSVMDRLYAYPSLILTLPKVPSFRTTQSIVAHYDNR